MCDLYLHRDIERASDLRTSLISLVDGGSANDHLDDPRAMLPFFEPLVALGSPPDTVLPTMASYPRLVSTVFDRYGWNADEFRGYRLNMRYPPLTAAVMVRYDLPV